MFISSFKKNKQEVILIAPDILNSFSGVEVHGESLYSYLKKNNLLKGCISYKHQGIKNNSELDDGVYIRNKTKNIVIDDYLTKDIEKDKKLIEKYIDSSKKEITFFLNNPSWLLIFENIDKHKYNLIVRSSGNDILGGWIAYENKKSSIEKNREKLVKTINKKVDTLIVNSQYTYNKFVELGISRDRLVKITGGVSSDFRQISKLTKEHLRKALQLSKDKKIIINCSRFVKFKGIENTLHLIKELKEKSKIDFIYIIIGSGPLEKKYKLLVKTLGITDKVYFLGYKNHNDLIKYLQASDLFLHLPINYIDEKNCLQTETMGRSICEAICCGLPIITSNNGGVPELIDNNLNGYVSEQNDFQNILEFIIKILNDDEIYKKMRKHSKVLSQKYYWKNIFNQYNVLLKNGSK